MWLWVTSVFLKWCHTLGVLGLDGCVFMWLCVSVLVWPSDFMYVHRVHAAENYNVHFLKYEWATVCSVVSRTLNYLPSPRLYVSVSSQSVTRSLCLQDGGRGSSVCSGFPLIVQKHAGDCVNEWCTLLLPHVTWQCLEISDQAFRVDTQVILRPLNNLWITQKKTKARPSSCKYSRTDCVWVEVEQIQKVAVVQEVMKELQWALKKVLLICQMVPVVTEGAPRVLEDVLVVLEVLELAFERVQRGFEGVVDLFCSSWRDS